MAIISNDLTGHSPMNAMERRSDNDLGFVRIGEEEDELAYILALVNERDDGKTTTNPWENDSSRTSSSNSRASNITTEDEDDTAVMKKMNGVPALDDSNNGSPITAPSDVFSSSLWHTQQPTQDVQDVLPEPATAKNCLWFWDQSQSPDIQLLKFRELFTAPRKCTKCKRLVKSPRGQVTFASSSPSNLSFLLHAPCSACRTNHCRGCFSPVSCPVSCCGRTAIRSCPVETCCAEVRAIAVFEALGGFDKHYLSERASSEARAKSTLAKIKRKSSTVGPGGTGYATGLWGLLVGLLRKQNKDTVAAATKVKVNKHVVQWEVTVMRALTALTDLLPSPNADSPQPYDLLPHSSLGLLLSLSRLPELLDILLRNDSVIDWITRSETYHAMISLLRRLSDSELTIQVVVARRWEKEKSCGIEKWMWGDGEISWVKAKEGEHPARLPPLYEHLEKLMKQCQAFLAGAANLMEEEKTDVDEALMNATNLCREVIAAIGDMECNMAFLRNMARSNGVPVTVREISPGKGKGSDASADMERTYSLDCGRLAVRHVTLSVDRGNGLGLVYTGFYHAEQLRHTATSTRNPKDRLHLVKELAVMETCLPPGIWVRIDEVRNDAIKVMIAGPEGTPYAGGLFEFDCFMPIAYPNVPPLMQLRTTGNGRVRFNPNLYACGKVCLSLLGTWPGRPEERWTPKSSFLQALVSVQSMILVDTPYYNEPGYGKAIATSPVSKSYNRNVSLQTVRWAMVEWLKDHHKNGIWSDVIVSHFGIRGEKIRHQIEEWAESDSRIRSYQINSTHDAGTVNDTVAIANANANGQTPVSVGAGLDLLSEFDRGLKLVQNW